MAAATVATSELSYLGSKVYVFATFTAISDTNTWAPTGLTKVEGVFFTNGANDVNTGATVSGGTVTFACTLGDMANVKVIAIGT